MLGQFQDMFFPTTVYLEREFRVSFDALDPPEGLGENSADPTDSF